MNYRQKCAPVLLCIGLLLVNVLPGKGQAREESSKYSFNFRNIIPALPENSALGTYGNTPINTGTGLPNISFNLYTLTYGGVSIPISINYDASGIKYNDIPSAVGMKWSLNAGGSINRSVNGIVDEDYLLDHLDRISESHIDYENQHVLSHQSQDSAAMIAEKNLTDCSLDAYFYSFPGNSGSMYLGSDRQFHADKSYSKLKIDFINKLDSFVIKDDVGNTYIFGAYNDNSRILNSGKFLKQGRDYSARVSWKLQTIITASKKRIHFEYTPYMYDYTATNSERYTAYIAADNYNGCPVPQGNDGSFQTSHTYNTVSLLTKISTDDQEVIFGYEENSVLPIWKKLLTSIKVYSKISADTIKRIQLNFNDNYLANFKELDKTQGEVKRYSFGYEGSGGMTDPNSKNRDILGYYNGASNIDNLMANSGVFSYAYPYTSLANRNISPSDADAGTLIEIQYPTGGSTRFEYEYNTDTIGGNAVYAPGLRVKRIRDYDVNSKTYHEKRYKYKDLHGGYTFEQLSVNNDPSTNPTIASVFVSDNFNLKGIENYYYGEVLTEQVADSLPTLYTKDHYDAQWGIYDKITPLLLRTDLYKDDTLHKTRSIIYDYAITSIDSIQTRTYKLQKPSDFLGVFYYENDPSSELVCSKTVYSGYEQEYLLYPILYNIIKQTTIDYSTAGDLNTEQTSTYYDNPVYLRSQSTVDSKSVTRKITYEYPFNFTGDATMAQMTDSMVLAPVIRETTYSGTDTIFRKTNDYSFNAAGFFQQDKQHLTNMRTGTTQLMNFYAYDDNNNLLESGKEDDVRTAYVYDYQHIYPIATVTNADHASVAATSFEADGKGNWAFNIAGTSNVNGSITGNKAYAMVSGDVQKTLLNNSVTYVVSYWLKNSSGSISINGGGGGSAVVNRNGWTLYHQDITGATSVTLSGTGVIDELRLYPKSAQMITYTYEPLAGVTSTCDANNRITYYEYDALQRLTLIRDQDKNILKKICYSYLGQPSGCEVVYYNVAKSQSFTRNNCASGGTPGSDTYTVAAGAYTSIISQADADNKAQNDIDINGQTVINGRVACTFSNTEQSGNFQKNNCASGGTGSTVTYTVAAAAYTSTVSQADADQQAINDVTANGQGYANSNGYCTFYNAVQSGNFTKNDCSAGGTGSTVTYTVAANSYSSTVSQADADQQAVNAVNANGQAYANSNGYCTFYNATQSGNFTKNNCAAGGTGSVVTYTVNAGVYSSTTSQADADQQAVNAVNASGQSYANSNGYCTFYNAAQSGNFTKNNCAAGGTGSVVTYTANAGVYSSTTSQADADQQAVNAVSANGQSYANSNGYCTFYNTAQSGNFTKNDCGTGGTGSTVTYTVAANSYSSTSSQADADQQAINAVNASGQSYANSNGSCTYYNTEQSGWFQKNNCYPGAGSNVLYTIPAGTYSSTSSQADANQTAVNAVNANGQAYANNNGYCTYYSAAYSANFQKNDCASGGTGSTVNYSVGYGAYTSTSSQYDADQQAINAVNANGQSYANSNGYCTFYNTAQSGNFQKNDCGTGGTGSWVTYTVGANNYTSTSSQADANQQAVNAVNASGQSYANSNGYCTYYNTAQSAWFQKNNCSSGVGSNVLYTIGAGNYTSNTSQADADQIALNAVYANGQSYANSNGYCTYYNSPQSGNFQKYDCASGGTGSWVTYTVAANSYSSTVSQADADEQAAIAVNVYGPGYANANGYCTFYNTAQSANFTKNDCSSGGYGSTVSYGIGAGYYSSTISQADADQKALDAVNGYGQTYANLVGSCTFYNSAQSGNFTKNDCASGGSGSTVTYTIPASTYTSSSSQYDADQQAINAVNANGQSYANSNGYCTFYNTYQSATFTRNDCGSGYLGTTFVMDVPAYTYSSTSSQADANQQAINYINAYGQTYANTNASCYVPNIYPVITYENTYYSFDGLTLYGDVVLRVYSDAGCTQPFSPSSVYINYARSNTCSPWSVQHRTGYISGATYIYLDSGATLSTPDSFGSGNCDLNYVLETGTGYIIP